MCDPETDCQVVVVITIVCDPETDCQVVVVITITYGPETNSVRLLSLLLLCMAQRQTVLGGCYCCFELLGTELTPFRMLGRDLTLLCTPSPEL